MSSLPPERGGGTRTNKEVQVVTSGVEYGVMIGRSLQVEYLGRMVEALLGFLEQPGQKQKAQDCTTG